MAVPAIPSDAKSQRLYKPAPNIVAQSAFTLQAAHSQIYRRSSSGSLATLAAMPRASSRVRRCAAARRPGSSSK